MYIAPMMDHSKRIDLHRDKTRIACTKVESEVCTAKILGLSDLCITYMYILARWESTSHKYPHKTSTNSNIII